MGKTQDTPPPPPPDSERDPIPIVWSIGHSHRTLDELLARLKAQAIELVVDVRNRPHYNFVPEFSKRRLKSRLVREGILYVFLGDELAAHPSRARAVEPAFTDVQRIERSDRFLKGMDWLLEECRHSRIALLCGEADPAPCHRHYLVAQNLLARGVRVQHILWDGTVDEATPDLFHRP